MKEITTPLTEIIPKGKKTLLKRLHANGFITLEDCAMRGSMELYKIRGVGQKAILALKEHCFRKKIYWRDSRSDITKLAVHLASRYRLSPPDAEMVATAFYWDNCWPSSLLTPLF